MGRLEQLLKFADDKKLILATDLLRQYYRYSFSGRLHVGRHGFVQFPGALKYTPDGILSCAQLEYQS